MMEGLFLKIHNDWNYSGKKPNTLRVASFRLNEESARSQRLKVPVGVWIPIKKQPKLDGSSYRFLKCIHCEHEDFNEDGERLNDYVCNGCGHTISVDAYKEVA